MLFSSKFISITSGLCFLSLLVANLPLEAVAMTWSLGDELIRSDISFLFTAKYSMISTEIFVSTVTFSLFNSC